MKMAERDSRTQHTASDALICKYSALKLGYFVDPFLRSMLESQPQVKEVRKAPIINRGYYARETCIQALIRRFLDCTTSNDQRQIVSLGSGLDTKAINLLAEHKESVRIWEVDFPSMIDKKVEWMLSQSDITRILLSEENNPTVFLKTAMKSFQLPGNVGYQLGSLSLLSGDLRDVPAVIASLQAAGVNSSAPTLILTECVLVYVDKEPAVDLCTAIGRLFSEAVWVSYDMINPSDPFGAMMLRNLREAKYHIPGFLDFPSLDKQRQRFLDVGWDAASSVTMNDAYNGMVSASEKHRIARLEIFDEIEEWVLIMSHYALTVAVKGEGGVLSSVFEDSVLKKPYPEL